MGIFRNQIDNNSAEIIAWGRVVRAPELNYTKTKNVPKVTWSIAYGDKEYLNCLALGNRPSTRIAKCLEKGDIVIIAGTLTRKDYEKRDGSRGVWVECLCDAVICQPDVARTPDNDTGPMISQPPAAMGFFDDDDDGDLPF